MPAKKYTIALLPAIEQAVRNGAGNADLAKIAGVRQDTFKTWIAKYPELKNAIDAAQIIRDNADELEKIRRRKQLAEEWVEEYLTSKGAITEETFSETLGDGEGNFESNTRKITKGKKPDWRLLDRILGQGVEETFRVELSIAEPYDPLSSSAAPEADGDLPG